MPLFLKRVFAQNLSHENEFDVHENEAVEHIFVLIGSGQRTVLTQRQQVTKKRPIGIG